MIDKVRKQLKTQIESATGLTAYFVRTTDTATFPYITFDIQQGYSNYIDRLEYTVYVDAWNRNDVKALTGAIDNLDKAFKTYKFINDDFILQIYQGGSREFVEDEDKTIRHLLRTYDLIVYERN